MQGTWVHSLVWKILHAVGQLSPRVVVTEPMAYVPQLLKPERLGNKTTVGSVFGCLASFPFPMALT